MYRTPDSLWFSFTVIFVGCSNAATNPAIDSGSITDTAILGECEPHSTPPTNGCMTLMYDDLRGYGRRPDEHRMLYDGKGLLQSYDFRSALYADEYFICGYEWTDDSQPLSEWCSGQTSYTYRWEYDANGYSKAKYYDGASDGEIDRTWIYLVDDAGRITEEALDQDLDGTPDSFIWYQYNDQGLLLSDSWDYHGDQVVDYARDYFYDFDGRLVRVLTDSDADGNGDEEIEYSYDDIGNVSLWTEDSNMDGQWDVRRIYTYDDCSLTSISETESSGISNNIAYTYNEDGRLFREDYDWDDNGSRDAFAAWEYVCP